MFFFGSQRILLPKSNETCLEETEELTPCCIIMFTDMKMTLMCIRKIPCQNFRKIRFKNAFVCSIVLILLNCLPKMIQKVIRQEIDTGLKILFQLFQIQCNKSSE